MDTKPTIQRKLYLAWELVGAILGALTNAVIIAILMMPGENEPGPIEAMGFWFRGAFGSLIPGALAGAIAGLVSGRIGYAIKPSRWGSIGAAALGSVAVTALVAFLWLGAMKQQPATRAAYLQAAIPALPASFQELFAMEDFYTCAVSQDGGRLAVAGLSGTQVWDLEKNTTIGEPLPEDPLSFRGKIEDLAFSPDGRTLATAAYPSVSWWEYETGELRLPASDFSGMVSAIDYSPDGQLMATAGGEDSVAILWDPSSGKEITRLEGVSGLYPALAFSPDGKLLAVKGDNNQVILFATTTYEPVGLLAQPKSSPGRGQGSIRGLAFSPDGKRLAAAISYFDSGNVAVWEVEPRTAIGVSLLVAHLIEHVNFNSDGQRLVSSGTGSPDLYVWDASTLAPLGKIAKPPGPADTGMAYYLPDGRLVACYEALDSQAPIGILTLKSP